ncbi:MAG: hypothetical protein AAGA58_08030 [Verrucomicrobiota bacterium]
MPVKTYFDTHDQLQRTLQHYRENRYRKSLEEERILSADEIDEMVMQEPRLADFPFFGVAVRPHRFLVPGDFILYEYRGDYRTPIWSVTSKGFRLSDYWIQFERVKRGIVSDSFIHRIWLPGDRGLDPCGVPECVCAKPVSVRPQALDHPATKLLFERLVADEALTRK